MKLIPLAGLIMLSLSACISLPRKNTFHILSSGSETEVSVYESKVGLHTNIHGGHSDTYQIIVPRHIDEITAQQFIKIRFNYQEIRLNLSPKSEIKIHVGNEQCELTINLFDATGKPYSINGTYTNTNHLACQR